MSIHGCANPCCQCRVDEEDAYCADSCAADAEGGALATDGPVDDPRAGAAGPACHCGHRDCGASA